MKVSAKSAFSTALTGVGCIDEQEVVLLGGEHTARSSAYNKPKSLITLAQSASVVDVDTHGEDGEDWIKKVTRLRGAQNV